MRDEDDARPISGEIIAGSPEAERRVGDRRVGERRTEAADVVDAEFVTIARSGERPQAAANAEPPSGSVSQASPGMDILRGKAAERGARHGSHRGGPLFWTFGLCIVIAAFWVSGGHALVSKPAAGLSEPATAPAPGALRLDGVKSRIERNGDRFFLLVDGEVVNDGSSGAAIPGLEISVAGKDGRVTRYFLGTSAERLGPGGRFAFSSRLEAPKDGVETVTVDFRKEG